jgi:hypothetical protein
MKGLYQWLSQRASFFRFDASGRGTSRTVRTEVTVQRGMTLLVGGAADFDACPVCGNKLSPEQTEQVSGRLLKGSISQESGPGDRSPP